MNNAEFIDLGIIGYRDAWKIQYELHENIYLNRNHNPFYLIFCEHPHVYSLGKNGKKSNLLINNDYMKGINAEFVETDRGGDITYHGPGQIVGYPIIDLNASGYGIKNYVSKLEESVINTLKEFNIESTRISGATGVWIKGSGKPDRKICAIGVKVSRWITMHGFAFNINTNLKYFNFINPCGFTDKGVTSLSEELGFCPDVNDVKNILKINLSQQLNLNLKQKERENGKEMDF